MDQTENKNYGYWGSLEELEKTTSFQDSKGKEWASPPQEQKITEMERRTFLKLMGASLAMASTACARKPVEKIVPYVNKPEEIVLGVADWYTSTCQECSAGCGTLVKTREGRPLKLEGNPSHPVNQGGLCARGQASLLNLYSPQRLKAPLKVDGAIAKASEVTWAAADEAIAQSLADAKSKGLKVAVLTGAVTSPSYRQLIQDFLGGFSGGKHVAYEGVIPEEVAQGQQLSYGQKITPRYHFEKAQVILSLGADFLGTWISPVEYSKGFSKNRKDGVFSQLIMVEPAVSLTGINADSRLAVKSGDELAVALAIANEVQKAGVSLPGGSFLSAYASEKVAADTGTDAALIKMTAKALVKARGKGLVLGGALKARQGVALQVVANWLNSALGNEGETVDGGASSFQAFSSYSDLVALIDSMKKGEVGVLLISRTNPVFDLPGDLRFEEALKKVPMVVSLAESVDETAALSTYVCPDSSPFEKWGDANPVTGVYSLVQPTIRPLYQTRAAQDSLIVWGQMGGNWHDALQNYWRNNIFMHASAATSFEDFWAQALQKGVVYVGPGSAGGARRFNVDSLRAIPTQLSKSADFALILTANIPQYDGRSAGNAWLQELPDPVSKITWGNYISIAPRTAKTMNFHEGDVVRLSGNGFALEAPVHLQPMMHEKALSIPVGFGRTQVGMNNNHMAYGGQEIGNVGLNVGVKAIAVQMASSTGVEWGARNITSLTKTGERVRLACTQEGQVVEGDEIIHETTPAALAVATKPKEEDVTMWKEHEYNGYKWGMSIDMSACTGCNGCMIGCQSENNVPVVGKEQVLVGRSMHWIRIDRYYKGEMDQPEATFQPVLCQQCENAPCETVCPVVATVHNSEGLNDMIYNRCVGTRYCSNNCPYKVRRFNYFEFTESMTSPLNLVFNPDVMVREQGVMEKCTFCIQRIRVAKDTAKDEGRKVHDGEIKTACQQSCPTDAIVFGDLNDPESKVSKLRESARGYHLLGELNTKPRVTYLAKVRNKLS